MNTPLIVGFGAQAQVGKDYGARYLRDRATTSGYVTIRLAFADALKDDLDPLVRSTFGFSAHTSDSYSKMLLRPLLVAYGNQRRAQYIGCWVNAVFQGSAMSHATRLAAQGIPVLVTITDVRFDNELAKLLSLGGMYLHVEANKPYENDVEAENAPRLALSADRIIHNNFTDDFGKSVVGAVNDLLCDRNLDSPKIVL